jgi:periplasmic protein CpxP/Spy
MNKNTFYILIIVCLVISNLFLLYRGNKEPKMHTRTKEIIIERLKFDEKQIAEFEELIEVHREQTREHHRGMIDLKNDLYSHLQNPIDSMIVDSLTREIGIQKQKIEKINYNHFESIKEICHLEQLKDYIELTSELARLLEPPRPPRPPHGDHKP